MIGFYDYTVILTYLGLISGMSGIFFSINSHPVMALICLMFAGFCDGFDGYVARTKKNRTAHEKKFGIELDSLADLICYGVLPSVILYNIGMNTWYYSLILICYTLAALIRLAYFNVMEDARQEQTSECRKSYEGLPVTTMALILPLFYPVIMYFTAIKYILFAMLMILVGSLFLSKITIPKFKLKGLIVLIVIGIIEVVLLVLPKVLWKI